MKQLLEEHPYTTSLFENAKMERRTIYVANSRDKIRRIMGFLRKKRIKLPRARFVTIWPLFEQLYDILPPEERLSKRTIPDSYAKIILRHLLANKRKYLFPSVDFALSPETSDFFLIWIKNIKEYNLYLSYREGEISYRKDASLYNLKNKENRYNERLLSVLGNIFSLYEKFLKDNKLVDLSDKRWWVIDHLRSEYLKKYKFYIEHLSILRTVEKKLFSKIYQGASSVSLLDFKYTFPGERFTTTGIIDGNAEIIEIEDDKKQFSQEIKLYKNEKKENEVDTIARMVAKTDMDEPFVVISPDINEYENTFARILPRYNIHPPALSQRKLSQFPIIKTCLALFEIINQNLKRRAVVCFLLSPHIKLLKDREKKLIDRITKKELIVSGKDWNRLKGIAEETVNVSSFINELVTLKKKRGKSFIEHYISLLDSLMNIEKELEDEIKPYNKFREYIISLTRKPLVKALGEFGIKDFQRIISSYTESIKLTVDKKIDERIELLSLEETSGMNFDRVFLTGLVEGKLPKEPRPNPLFSEKLLEEMGFPTYNMLYALSKFNFESVMRSAKKIYCSYYEKDEKGNVFLMSPFLHEIMTEEDVIKDDRVQTLLDWQMGVGEIIHKGDKINETLFVKDMQKRALMIKEAIKRLRDENRLRNVKNLILSSNKFQEYVKKRLGRLSKSLSPYALETYKRCPYSYFLHYILLIGETVEPEEGMDNLIRGKVIHRILSRFYERRLSKTIKKDLIDEWENMRKIAHDAIEKMIPGTRDRILLRLELTSQDYKSLLKRFLDTDIRENINNTVEYVEWEFSGRDVYIKCNGEILGLLGRIDRIDKNNERLIIFDYKTGSKTNIPGNRHIEGGESFQFPIYTFAVEKCLGKVQKAAYYLVNSKEGVFSEERKRISQELLISNISKLWTEIKNLNYEPKHKSNCRTTCIFNELCPEA